MEVQKINELAEIMRENGITLLEITEGGISICMERKAEGAPASAAQAVLAAQAPAAEGAPRPEQKEGGAEIKSPMVGVFYRGAAPGAEPFVQAGSRVKKGDTLCILEAMKLLNEITADRDGTIARVCAEDGQAVEYGQVLFQMTQE